MGISGRERFPRIASIRLFMWPRVRLLEILALINTQFFVIDVGVVELASEESINAAHVLSHTRVLSRKQ